MSEEDEDMTPEERRRQMDFILNQQAQFAANHQRSEERIGRLERVMKLVVRAGLRERKETREKINALIASQTQVNEALTRMADAQANLADAQAHSDARLDALIDIVRNGRNGKS
jgi:hypothetical protein